MENDISKFVIEINNIRQRAYRTYLPVVEELCSRRASEDELSHCFDYLLDFADDECIFGLFGKLCKTFEYTYPECIEFYSNAYKEMFENAET